jgi:hypothetical protein
LLISIAIPVGNDRNQRDYQPLLGVQIIKLRITAHMNQNWYRWNSNTDWNNFQNCENIGSRWRLKWLYRRCRGRLPDMSIQLTWLLVNLIIGMRIEASIHYLFFLLADHLFIDWLYFSSAWLLLIRYKMIVIHNYLGE